MPDATSEFQSISVCLACGTALPPALERSASLRCHDCRDAGAPLRADLVARIPGVLRTLRRLSRAA